MQKEADALPDRADREDVPQGRHDAQREPDDDPVRAGRRLQHRHARPTPGKAQIRKFFATKNTAFMPQNHWEADTPSYQIKATVNGDKGTLYFECDYIDSKTGKVVAAVGVDHQVQKINGKWLIIDSCRGAGVAEPPRGELMAQPGRAPAAAAAAAVGGARRLGQPARARGRACAGEGAHEAARRLPRHRRAARARRRARAALPRPGERPRRAARHAPAALVDLPDELQTQASMLRQLLGFRAGGDPGPATFTGGEELVRRAARGRSSTSRSASLSRSSGRRRARRPTASCRRPADERMLRRIRRDYHRFDDAMTTSQDARQRRRTDRRPSAAVPRRRAIDGRQRPLPRDERPRRADEQPDRRPDHRESQRLHALRATSSSPSARSASRSRSASGWSSRGR